MRKQSAGTLKVKRGEGRRRRKRESEELVIERLAAHSLSPGFSADGRE